MRELLAYCCFAQTNKRVFYLIFKKIVPDESGQNDWCFLCFWMSTTFRRIAACIIEMIVIITRHDRWFFIVNWTENGVGALVTWYSKWIVNTAGLGRIYPKYNTFKLRSIYVWQKKGNGKEQSLIYAVPDVCSCGSWEE